MKKTFALVLSVIAVLTLSACTKIDEEFVGKYIFEQEVVEVKSTFGGETTTEEFIQTADDYALEELLIPNLEIAENGKLVWNSHGTETNSEDYGKKYVVLNGSVKIKGEVLELSGIAGWDDLETSITDEMIAYLNASGLNVTKEELLETCTLTSTATIKDGKIVLVNILTMKIKIVLVGEIIVNTTSTQTFAKEIVEEK